MTTVHAYAASEAKGELQPFQYELGPIGVEQVDIAVESCGICHSDLSMLDNEWQISQYPFVPGHEVIGRVSQIGDQVSHLEVGDRVGLGWQAGYCNACNQCLSGNQNLCQTADSTIVGRHGGFADLVRAKSTSVIPIPEGLDAKKGGPLLCGGITVFDPFLSYGISPTANVGVIGIGGLGHMALKFANAWGCQVTAFTSPSKREEALSMGAHDTINSRDMDQVASAAGRFDLVLSTVNVSLDWNTVMSTLRPQGRLHMLGAVLEPVSIQIMPMIMSKLTLSASPVGSPFAIGKMLEFAANHKIAPVTEHFPMSKVNDAMDRLRSGDARYRIVLDRE